MTEAAASAKKEITDVQVNVGKDLSTVTIGDSKVEVSADGKKVTAYTKDGVEAKAAGTAAAAEEGTKISISKDFNAVVLNGVTIELAADGHLVITAPGVTVIHKPAPANDTSAIALLAGAKMVDGSVFAGMTADGKQQIYAMPDDLDVTMTFNDAAKAVKKLNSQKALGHDDWQIPGKENLLILQKNQNEGTLKGTFKTAAASGSDYPDWYWSSTEHRDDPSGVWAVRFSDGYGGWDPKDNLRLSCRPVRLVAASAPAPG
jgi:hypothetical protein